VSDLDLARAVDAAQSILETPSAREAQRVERALAETNRATIGAMARLGLAAAVIEVAGGLAVFAGEGNPMTQGLAMGIGVPVTAAELDAMEAHGVRQLEICPYVDPSLPALLAQRGYRVHEWQLVWLREIPKEPLAPPPPELTLRRAREGEEDIFFRTMLAGFLETEEVPAEAIAMMKPNAFAERYELMLAFWGDEPIGAASFTWADGVMFGGSGVRPAYRRRGAQGALIRARLDRARELGCALACSNTLPGTASRRNMERHGYHVAYPKLVMLK
jgi:GNAT superfamily N-acetyltransferase